MQDKGFIHCQHHQGRGKDLKEITKKWLKKAEDDYKAAKKELSVEPILSSISCFHSQQCAEKLLKAIIIEHDIEPDRTHDLVFLLKILTDKEPSLLFYEDDLRLLTAYSVDVRYPGEEISLEEAKKALECTERIKNQVKKLLGS